MAVTQKQRRVLQKFLKELEPIRGRHTELVSVYVPAGYDLNKIIGHLAQEQGTASNIKDSNTRKNVQDSLERMIQHLRLFKQTPANGLAVFSGNKSEREGVQDIGVWSLEPPEPLNFRLYRCDKNFVLDALIEIAQKKEIYGLLVLDRRDAMTALLSGKTIIPLSNTSSNVPGKTRAGGQSSQRFERIREGAAKDFYRKVAEYVKNDFLEKKDLKGIMIGGPGQTKYEFLEVGELTDLLKQKVIAVKDLSYTGEFGLQELVEKCQDVLAKEEIMQEKALMGRFFELLSKKPKQVTYGLAEVRRMIDLGVVDIVLVSETVDDSVIEELEKSGEQFGTKVEVISVETREGVQLKEMGKFAAILRYEVE